MCKNVKNMPPAMGESRTAVTAWLGLANMASFCMSLALASILSRFMDQSAYGTYCQIFYVYNTLLIIFSLGLPKSYSYFLTLVPVNEGRSVVCKLNMLFMLLGALFSLTLFCGSGWIAGLLGNPMLDQYIRCFSPVPLLLMPVIGVEGVLTVYKKTRLIFIYVLISRLVTLVCVVMAVTVFDTGIKGAVTGFVVASALTCAVGLLLMYIPFSGIGSVCSSLRLVDVFRFSLPVFYAGIYGFIILSSSPFFVSRYFGECEFAVFANGFRELPLANMIVSAVGTVMLPEFLRMRCAGTSKSEYVSLWNRTVYKSAALIYPVAIYCFIFAEDIMMFLFGNGYQDAAHLFRIITVVNFVRVLPYGPIMFAVGKGNVFANIHLFIAILIVCLDIVCVRFFPSFTGIAVIFVSTTILCLILLMKSISRMFDVSLSRMIPWGGLVRLLVSSLLAGLVSKVILELCNANGELVRFVIGSFAYLMVYIFVSRIAGIRYFSLIKSVLSTFRLKTNNP
ncbi:hypothetical protein IE90_14115 [Sanguibacteroides justesenii]|uniref:Polysaccharide biosynthesis protein C-terminal domain-containing protein n=2 Tax=Porphyromonadaceae TaxID=171551 RepID=A0A0C3REP7_9PORP|nr:hypothetical protein IE90_14115 [Sanguibacteroides justesenii]KIO45026.1 hypothetical protein BA92_08490 [Sanguibacteroides justesenii]